MVDITVGPDGALWFTNYSDQMIGRITTAGVLTFYPVPYEGATGITTGPDGALWFADGPYIGRITTSGQETMFTNS